MDDLMRNLIVVSAVFISSSAIASCPPDPDFFGKMVVEKCEAVKLSSEDQKGKRNEKGVVLKGFVEPTRYIADRQTKREPSVRPNHPSSKQKFENLGTKVEMEVYYQTDVSKACSQYSSGTKINLEMYFYCCEPQVGNVMPCASGTSYYTEKISTTSK